MTPPGTADPGEAAAFGERVERHRRELHVHCYRMLGSRDDADDIVQETMTRAWAQRAQFDGSDLFRAWLYRIATNACLDLLRRQRRRARLVGGRPTLATAPWAQPYPDRLLDESADGPDSVAVRRETVELAFLAALQLLPARQRAVLVLRDVAGWSAADTAAALGMTVAAANSAVQRARATMREHHPTDRMQWGATSSPATELEVVRRFMDACERYDVDQMVALAGDGIRMTAPPDPRTWDGRDAFAAETAEGFGIGAPGVLRCLPTRANGRPAVAGYLRRWDDALFRPFVLDVLHVDGDGRLAALTSFAVVDFDAFALPRTLPA